MLSEKKGIEKVHILFNAKEKERIVNPILKEKPDVIYYFFFKGYTKDVNLDFMEENIKLIKSQLPEVIIERRGVDYVNYYEVIQKLVEIIGEYKNQKPPTMTINLGTGAKMVAIAVMDAQRLWKCFHLKYPYSKDYDPNRTGAKHQGKLIPANIPDFNYKIPPLNQIQALQCFKWLIDHDRFNRQRNYVKQKDWRDKVFEKEILKVKPKDDKRREENLKNQKMSQKIVQPLQKDLKFIKTIKKGRSIDVSLTSQGKNFVKIIEHYDYGIDLPKKK